MRRMRLDWIVIAGALSGLMGGLSGCRTVEAPGSRSGDVAEAEQAFEGRPLSSGVLAGTRSSSVDKEEERLSGLNDYLRMAALRNAGLEAAFHRWQAALQRVPQVGAPPDPRVTYGYFIREIETRVGPQNRRMGLSQTIPWFGKLSLREDQAGHAARAAREEYEAEKLRLFYRVKELYFEFYYLKRSIEITEENIELLKGLERVAQARFRAGGDAGGVVKAQLEIGKQEDRLKSLWDLRGPIVAQLNAVLHRTIDADLSWPERWTTPDVVMDEAALLEVVGESNPELRALSHQIAVEKRGVDLARKDFYPDWTVGVDYIETGQALNPAMAGSGDDPVMAMVSVNIPLWRGKYRAALEEAREKQAAALRRHASRGDLLESEMKMTLYRYRDAGRKAALYQGTMMPLARNSLGVARESYQAGKVDFLELIDAQRLLLEFQLAYERSLVDREQRLAQVELLSGREVGRGGLAPPIRETKENE